MNRNLRVMITLAVTILIFTMPACGSLGPPTPSVDGVASIVAGTLQALTALASPITPPTFTPLPPPTSTLAPTAALPSSNLPSATRINFATGATEAAAEGAIGAAQTLHYVVRASKDQPMMVTLISPDAKLSIFGANGTVLLPASQGQTGWQGILPVTQDYYFEISGASSTQNFTLDVTIPARLQFPSGQNQIAFTGQTGDGYGIHYVVYALVGQKMDVTLNTDASVAALTIYGFTDGQPYARAQNGITNFNMTVPSTQDYIIHVVPHTSQVVNYKVTFKIQ